MQRAWLERYPDDYAMRDIGEPISLMADALEIIACEGREKQARETRDASAAAA